MKIRLAKVRVTRPGGKSPLERGTLTRGGSVPTGLDYLMDSQKREAAQHDRAIAGMEYEVLLEIRADLAKRMAWDRKNPEYRWIMGRLAAACRKLLREGVLA